MEAFMELWNEYYPILLAVGGTILTVGGIILSAYLVIKPKIDWFKSKIEELKSNTTKDSIQEDLTAKLQSVDISTKITNLEEKIANPLTSDSARASYTTQLKVLIEVQTKLDSGIAVVEETQSKF
jgi:hypothetical protein